MSQFNWSVATQSNQGLRYQDSIDSGPNYCSTIESGSKSHNWIEVGHKYCDSVISGPKYPNTTQPHTPPLELHCNRGQWALWSVSARPSCKIVQDGVTLESTELTAVWGSFSDRNHSLILIEFSQKSAGVPSGISGPLTGFDIGAPRSHASARHLTFLTAGTFPGM